MSAEASGPHVVVTAGDSGGIGPEVIVKALADEGVRRSARFTILGVHAAFEAAARAAGVPVCWRRMKAGQARPGDASVVLEDLAVAAEALEARPTQAGGASSFGWVNEAIDRAMLPIDDARRADAIVTGPISKKAWELAGHGAFPGHTELLASRFPGVPHAMMFESPLLRVILATTHVPLARVPSMLTTARVLEVIGLGHEACVRLGIAGPRVAVCGLNPHAGEEGLLGEEDARVIGPAVEAARLRGIEATGPWPGDTVWSAAASPSLGRGAFDLVVAMYHDQGLAPLKLVAWREAVNLTVGLPIVRTSPDHGTAFDLAGKNKADPGSMRAAIELAVRMVARR